jgi:probable addiction module antidote protein
MRKKKKSSGLGLFKRRLDPAYAMEYLTAALADDAGADAIHYLALLDVARANHMTYLAESTGIKREDLYKRLARRGNPGINRLRTACNAIGLRLPLEGRGPKAARVVARLLQNLQAGLGRGEP